MVPLKQRLQKYYISFAKGSNTFFTLGKQRQKAILNKRGIPSCDIERSYYQYECQMELLGRVKSIIVNIASVPFAIISIIRPYKKPSSLSRNQNSKPLAVFVANKDINIIPQSIINEFDIIITNANQGSYLSNGDKTFLLRAFTRHPMSFHWFYKCSAKAAEYRYQIEKYHPSGIISACEFSFTSSLLTHLCERDEVEHINVMHGEKLFDVKDSYFRFSRCYVWSIQYINLFESLKASRGQFIVELPKSMTIEIPPERDVIFDMTYYLGDGSKKSLASVAESLTKLYSKGMRIAIRPHPSYCDRELVQELFGDFFSVEDVESVSLEESIGRAKLIASAYSTVLHQAYLSGAKIVIDDVSNPTQFNKLVELDYIMIDKRYRLLSEIIQDY